MRGTGGRARAAATLTLGAIGAIALTGCGLAVGGLMAAGDDGGSPDGSTTETAPADATTQASPDGSHPQGGVDGGALLVPDATSASDAANATDAATTPDAADAACPPPLGDASVTTAARASSPPTIDGYLSDWGCGPWTELNAKNAAYVDNNNGQTISGQFAVRWDENNVYFAAHILVPKLQGTNTTDLFYNDAVEIFVSGDSPVTGQYDPQSHQYVVDWNDNAIDYGPLNYSPAATQPTSNPPSFTWKAVTVSGGWQVEAAIGWQALLRAGATAQLSTGTSIAFDVAFDDGNGSAQQMYLLAMDPPSHPIPPQCSCPTCCCGWVSPSPDLPSCDTFCFGGLTLE